jgi:hypothetical protein
MTILENIVDVRITKPNSNMQSGDFGTLLIIGNSSEESGDRLKQYSDMKEVIEDYESSTSEYKAAFLAFSQSMKIDKILIAQIFKKETIEKAYPLITKENNDFYAVMMTSKKPEDQLKLSELIETDCKIFGISSKDEKILDAKDTGNILYKLCTLKRKRTFVIYNSSAGDGVYPESAWFGLMLAKPAGSATWSYQELTGVKTDNFHSSEISALNKNNGNYFTSIARCGVMLTGAMVDGEWIDIIRGLDWLRNHLQTNIGRALISSEKIAYTNHGVAVIEATIRHSLNDAVRLDIVDSESIKVSVPDVRKVSESDKQSRILKGVTFEATLAGAVHMVKVQGSIST